MELWFTPQGDESMKMEDMETYMLLCRHTALVQRQELLLTLSQMVELQQSKTPGQYQYCYHPQQAGTAPHSHLRHQVSLFKKKIIIVITNRYAFFFPTFFPNIRVLALFIFTTNTCKFENTCILPYTKKRFIMLLKSDPFMSLSMVIYNSEVFSYLLKRIDYVFKKTENAVKLSQVIIPSGFSIIIYLFIYF